MLTTLHRAGLVLDLFAREQREWRATDVARELDVPMSSAHELLSSLATIGLLRAAHGCYSVGPRVGALAEQLRKGLGFWSAAGPEMALLAATARETVLLAVLDGSDVIYIDSVTGLHPTGRVTVVPAGTRRPAATTAAGRALLAHLPPSAARYVDDAAAWRGPSVDDRRRRDELEEELRGIRRRGFAEQRGALAADVHCVAAPLRDAQGEAVAALDFSVPVSRVAPARAGLIRELLASVDAVSEHLGV